MPVEDTETNDIDDTNTSMEDIEVDLSEVDESEDNESEDTPEDTEQNTEESNEDESTDESEDTEVVKSQADQQKAYNKQMAERRIAEKRQRDETIRQQQSSYIEGTEDPLEAATRQNQVELYNIKVENLTSKLENSYQKAIKDFDILTDTTPEVKAMVDEAIDTFQALYVPIDAYGNPKELKADFYQYLQNKAESIQKLTGIKSQKQVSDKTREKSKVFTPPAKTPKPTKGDPDMDAFMAEAYGK